VDIREKKYLPPAGIETRLFCHYTEPTVLAVCFEGRYKDPRCFRGRSTLETVAARIRCQKKCFWYIKEPKYNSCSP
jgi:hypothetical protein